MVQQTLAQELTSLVHSPAAYQQAAQTTALLFGPTGADLPAWSEQALVTLVANVPRITLNTTQWKQLDTVVDLVATQGASFSSKGEARRMIQNEGLHINKIKIETEWQPIPALLHTRYLLVQKGKNHHYWVIVQD